MTKHKKLSRKQLAVLDEIFLGENDEQQVLDKCKVKRSEYYRWLTDENFAEQFDRRIAAAYRQSSAIVARYATLAAAKLVDLTDSSSPETSRKACLDIISRQPAEQRRMTDDGRQTTEERRLLSPETASKILELLAQEKNDEKQ